MLGRSLLTRSRRLLQPVRWIAAGWALALAACPNGVDAMPEDAAVTATIRTVGGGAVRVREAGPDEGPMVLFFHGGRFHSGTWEELGTLALLGGAGYHAVAVDLPGFGESEASTLSEGAFVTALFDELGADRPVLIAASMSGRFAFPFLVSHRDRVAGFVALAPVRIAEHVEALRGSDLPALLLWGQDDRTVPVAEADLLAAALPNSRKVVLPGAGHPCYLDEPGRFHEELLAFLSTTLR